MYVKEGFSLEDNVKVIAELGICSTCSDVDSCARRIRHGLAVWECEEFDNFVEPSISAESLISESSLRTDYLYSPEIPTFSGLCVNCEIKNICRYPKPEEGVWHCNEYR